VAWSLTLPPGPKLCTNTTVALNPDTGKVVWYYQHMPNDQWDFDWAFERQIVPLRVANGQRKKLVVTAGKPGIYDAVEADTGKYVFSVDMGLQNFVTSIDPVTVAKKVDPNLIPGTGQPMVVCRTPVEDGVGSPAPSIPIRRCFTSRRWRHA
jgi:alcohol dehydrogenase (cytochrome c)